MDNFSALGISCLASVIVLIGVGVSKVLWNWFFLNVWLKVSYRHAIDVSGEWRSERLLTTQESEITVFTIEQYGWRLKGKMDVSYVGGIETEGKKFEIDGIIQSDILTFYYWNTNRRQRGVGSFTLEICNNCKELSGVSAYFAPNPSQIHTASIQLLRKE